MLYIGDDAVIPCRLYGGRRHSSCKIAVLAVIFGVSSAERRAVNVYGGSIPADHRFALAVFGRAPQRLIAYKFALAVCEFLVPRCGKHRSSADAACIQLAELFGMERIIRQSVRAVYIHFKGYAERGIVTPRIISAVSRQIDKLLFGELIEILIPQRVVVIFAEELFEAYGIIRLRHLCLRDGGSGIGIVRLPFVCGRAARPVPACQLVVVIPGGLQPRDSSGKSSRKIRAGHIFVPVGRHEIARFVKEVVIVFVLGNAGGIFVIFADPIADACRNVVRVAHKFDLIVAGIEFIALETVVIRVGIVVRRHIPDVHGHGKFLRFARRKKFCFFKPAQNDVSLFYFVLEIRRGVIELHHVLARNAAGVCHLYRYRHSAVFFKEAARLRRAVYKLPVKRCVRKSVAERVIYVVFIPCGVRICLFFFIAARFVVAVSRINALLINGIIYPDIAEPVCIFVDVAVDAEVLPGGVFSEVLIPCINRSARRGNFARKHARNARTRAASPGLRTRPQHGVDIFKLRLVEKFKFYRPGSYKHEYDVIEIFADVRKKVAFVFIQLKVMRVLADGFRHELIGILPAPGSFAKDAVCIFAVIHGLRRVVAFAHIPAQADHSRVGIVVKARCYVARIVFIHAPGRFARGFAGEFGIVVDV